MSIIRLENVSVRRDQHLALAHISWELEPGRNWAVIGGNGAGKSTFLSLIRGDIWPTQNMGVRHYFDDNGHPSLSPIGFREQTSTISAELIDHYLLLERVIDGKTLLMTGLRNTPLIYSQPRPQEWEKVHTLAQQMGVLEFMDRALPECSTGQLKRLFLARAMACRPNILFLDEYADGLDYQSRSQIMSLIDCMADSGVQIICATHRATELPDCINRILVLENGHILHAGPRTANRLSNCSPENIRQTAAMDFSLLPSPKPVPSSVPVLSLNKATVGIEGTLIVRDVSLDIQPGERWLITGPNGAGKSTLLRMIGGELPAAYGGEVRWFGQGRIPTEDTHENFLELKQRIGLVTPRLQTLHRMEISVFDVVLSGFWQHIGLHEYPTPAMEDTAQKTLAALGIENLARRSATSLSYGQLRKVIIARALVNSPSLLILDEPFSGLDAPSRQDIKQILNGLAAKGLTMILATHHPEEHEHWGTHKASIEDGTVSLTT